MMSRNKTGKAHLLYTQNNTKKWIKNQKQRHDHIIPNCSNTCPVQATENNKSNPPAAFPLTDSSQPHMRRTSFASSPEVDFQEIGLQLGSMCFSFFFFFFEFITALKRKKMEFSQQVSKLAMSEMCVSSLFLHGYVLSNKLFFDGLVSTSLDAVFFW